MEHNKDFVTADVQKILEMQAKEFSEGEIVNM